MKTRDKKAALKFLKKSLKRHGGVGELVTDCLRSYGAAVGELGIRGRQQTGQWLNNRVENSHQPFRRRERAMLRFRRMQTLQKIRLRPRLCPQPHQPGTQPQPTSQLQTKPRCRSRRVAQPLRGVSDSHPVLVETGLHLSAITCSALNKAPESAKSWHLVDSGVQQTNVFRQPGNRRRHRPFPALNRSGPTP